MNLRHAPWGTTLRARVFGSWRNVLIVLAAAGMACEPEIATSSPSRSRTPSSTTNPDGGAKDAGGVLPTAELHEAEFAESERSRDPFRSFAEVFVEDTRNRVKSQREVVLEQYSIDELKLAGIVTGIKPPRAMLVDPGGKGHVVVRGDFVGRPETVQASSQASVAYEVNWRVDRIRDGDIVLVREDPTNPDVPTATRVIALRPEGDLDKIEK
ncbi:MAG: pilus assembly protein PilP [Polyangiaceae bacterium]|nr:pilus assembly protein PilP [Polyangiaceae bacterium]